MNVSRRSILRSIAALTFSTGWQRSRIFPRVSLEEHFGDSTFEVTPLRGVDFILENSPTSRKYLIETMPGGMALLDYNNDGLLDIFW